MNNNNNQGIKHLTVSELLNNENYIVPIYQRNYAWGKEEIEQLIQDIESAPKDKNYYIGSLVVYQRNDGKFEVIDGQQRLTTLHLIALACGLNRKSNLHFEHRDNTKRSFEKLELEIDPKNLSALSTIEMGYRYAKKIVKDQESFKHFLNKNVIILRTEVPPNTDLNHYFEIMNNRGEQLEKHEILKANLMSRLEKEDAELFAMIWDSCADMNQYMVMGFPPNLRKPLFFDGDKATLSIKQNSFDELKHLVKDILEKEKARKNIEEPSTEAHSEIKNILSILNEPYVKDRSYEEDRFDRFSSIINFSNFLMHILRIYIDKYKQEKDSIRNIPLDDKVLLEKFGFSGKEEVDVFPDAKSIKEFVFLLLKARMLFDYYVIKTDATKNEHWSLMVPNYSGNSIYYKNTFSEDEKNENVIMLNSMFHTSYPSRNYKNWLYAVLHGLVLEEWHKDEKSYISQLELLSDKFYFNYYHQENRDFFDVIVKDKKIIKSSLSDEKTKALLNSGTAVVNFIFNRLDYLLWKYGKFQNSKKAKEFRFTFRSSVEHYYPQNPLDGLEKLDDEVLHSFGNLCLVSREKNAKLSNHTPRAKKDYYLQSNSYDSLKQQKMMEYENWTSKEIGEHGEEMLKLLERTSPYSE